MRRESKESYLYSEITKASQKKAIEIIKSIVLNENVYEGVMYHNDINLIIRATQIYVDHEACNLEIRFCSANVLHFGVSSCQGNPDNPKVGLKAGPFIMKPSLSFNIPIDILNKDTLNDKKWLSENKKALTERLFKFYSINVNKLNPICSKCDGKIELIIYKKCNRDVINCKYIKNNLILYAESLFNSIINTIRTRQSCLLYSLENLDKFIIKNRILFNKHGEVVVTDVSISEKFIEDVASHAESLLYI